MFPPQQILLGRYRYDPLDRLISLAQPTVPNHRFYCKSRLVTEIQGALRHSFVQHGDLLLAQHRHENDALGTTLLATDLQRSVLHTLEKNTGRQAIAYAPYGHRSAESGLTSLLGFNGERPDPVTGHYLLGNGYRAFNPVLMRFNSPDSLSPFGEGGLNAYGYCKGEPINHSDRTGHFPLPIVPSILFPPARTALGIATKFDYLVTNTTISTITTEFRSGPTRTFFDAIVRRKSIAGERWTEFTKYKDPSGIMGELKIVSKKNGIISGHHYRKHYFGYRATPSLLEMAYSKLPGTTIKQLHNKTDMPSMNEIDYINYRTELANTLSSAPPARSVALVTQQTMNKIRNGQAIGINPDFTPNPPLR